ncbi:MAG: excinuclease ABC subunit C [Balneola sp.]
MKESYVYMLSNSRRTVLYTSVTGNLLTRTFNHKKNEGSLFSSTYRAHCYSKREANKEMEQRMEVKSDPICES